MSLFAAKTEEKRAPEEEGGDDDAPHVCLKFILLMHCVYIFEL